MKTIPGFPNYSISKNGQVWSKPRKNTKGGRLKFSVDFSNHLRVYLYNEGKKVGKFIHRLVLETFVCPCPVGMEARHLNGKPQDNRLKNLAWGTRSENQIDSVQQQTHAQLKLTPQNIRMIIYMWRIKQFEQKEIAKIYNVSGSTINDIIHKRTWRHIWTKK